MATVRGSARPDTAGLVGLVNGRPACDGNLPWTRDGLLLALDRIFAVRQDGCCKRRPVTLLPPFRNGAQLKQDLNGRHPGLHAWASDGVNVAARLVRFTSGPHERRCPARSRVGLRLRFRLCARRALRAAPQGWQKRRAKGGGKPVLVCGLGPASADDEVEVDAPADVSGPGGDGRDGSCSERNDGCCGDEHRDGSPAPGWLVAPGRCAGHVGVLRVYGSVMAGLGWWRYR